MELRRFDTIHDQLLQEIGRLRVEAWQTETRQPIEMDTWLDDFDQEAHHWLVFEDGKIIGAARLTIHRSIDAVPDSEAYHGIFDESPPYPIASLNRLVVHPSGRRRGLSKLLDQVRLIAASELGCRSAVLSTASGPHRVNQLLQLGFTLAGYGPRFSHPPLCYLPAPAVLIFDLRQTAPACKNVDKITTSV